MKLDTRNDSELQDAKAEMRPFVVDLLHELRGGGIPNPMAALEQLSFLLLLLYLNPERWSKLVRSPIGERFVLLRKNLFPNVLRRPRGDGSALVEAMRDATFAFPSPELLDLVVHRLDGLPRGGHTCADLLDAALDEVSATSSVGSPRTPPAVSDCMIALTEPRTDHSVLDPAAGAGDRLLSVIRRTGEGPLRPGALVRGVDPDATIVRLGAMSLVFHGIEAPVLHAGNVLVDPPDPSERFDVILCQPPFGNRIDPSLLAPELRDLPNARSEVLFAEFTLKRLAAQGRAAIVLPVSAAFSSGAGPLRLRRRLLERLRAVVMLPQGTFQPHTNVETLIVAVGGPPTSRVVFFDARDSERGLSKGSVEILRRCGGLVDYFLAEGLPVKELLANDLDFEWVLVVDKDEIRESNFSLLSSTYRPAREAPAAIDSPFELFGEIEQAESEIAGHLAELGRRLAEWSSEHG